eukprot:145030_1
MAYASNIITLNRHNLMNNSTKMVIFLYHKTKKTATFAEQGSVKGVHDYQEYPAIRTLPSIGPNEPYTQTIKFKLFQYGWFGITNDITTPHGFPGYTNSAWMIRICDGGSWHNDIADAVGTHKTGDLTNQTVVMKYDPSVKQLTVIWSGNKYNYSHKDMPTDCAYFIFSFASGRVTIFDAQEK